MTDSVEKRPRYDDEISLVDLTATFIRRRKIFYLVFLLFTGGGVAYALFATETYEYVSLIQSAAKNGSKPVEEPTTTIATLENRWLPELQSNYRAENDQRLPLGVSFSNPENTSLLRLRTETGQDNVDIVKETHTSLIEKVSANQNAQIEREKSSLERQMESLDKVIESLQGQQDSGEAIAAAIQKQVSLESDLEQLEPLEVLVVSRESADRTGPNRRLIVVLAALLGAMLGVFLAFMAEFWVAVRRQIAEQGEGY